MSKLSTIEPGAFFSHGTSSAVEAVNRDIRAHNGSAQQCLTPQRISMGHFDVNREICDFLPQRLEFYQQTARLLARKAALIPLVKAERETERNRLRNAAESLKAAAASDFGAAGVDFAPLALNVWNFPGVHQAMESLKALQKVDEAEAATLERERAELSSAIANGGFK